MIYDGATAAYPLWAVIFIPAAIAVAFFAWAYFDRFDRRRTDPHFWAMQRKKASRFGACAAIAAAALTLHSCPAYWRTTIALKRGSYQVIEGRLTEASLAPPVGHAQHRLALGERRYRLSHGDPGFAEIANARDRLGLGTRVRILDSGGRIVRLEIF
ncbi:MAG TPA: hypothetical protein VF625_13820 [Longimicrobium sp.]|jgi:hypothetical protein